MTAEHEEVRHSAVWNERDRSWTIVDTVQGRIVAHTKPKEPEWPEPGVPALATKPPLGPLRHSTAEHEELASALDDAVSYLRDRREVEDQWARPDMHANTCLQALATIRQLSRDLEEAKKRAFHYHELWRESVDDLEEARGERDEWEALAKGTYFEAGVKGGSLLARIEVLEAALRTIRVEAHQNSDPDNEDAETWELVEALIDNALSPQTEEPYTRTVKDSPGTGRVTLEAAREAARKAVGPQTEEAK